MPAETEECDGVIFSGGEDLHPELYGKPEFESEFGLKEIIPERDQFEYEVIAKAFTAKKPVLGICRGLQLINVFLVERWYRIFPPFSIFGTWQTEWGRPDSFYP